MKGVYLAVLLTVFTYVFLATGIEGPYCFHFTWPGSKDDLDCDIHNDDDHNPFTPCMEPLISATKPNVTNIWNDESIKDEPRYIKQMEPGSVCVRFTYMYNGAVVNVSYFRGKVTEDQTTPVTSGCYVQYTEGYSIEVCACKSNSNSIPCNSTIRNTHSLLIICIAAAVSLFMYKILEVP